MSDMMDFDERTLRAQRQIAAILGQLEKDQRMIVRDIRLEAIDVTTMECVEPRFIRGVVIDLRPAHTPGAGWES